MNEIYKRYELILEALEPSIKCEPEPGTSYAHLRWMLNELKTAQFQKGKANRWLGFIQGIMIERGLLTVKEERDFTRPFFKNED